ncbi:MAG: hypothetical protein PHC53_01680 [Patescibacteria group bacterium]|nr:hypothetical protein [Patescibacteria group bacterium]
MTGESHFVETELKKTNPLLQEPELVSPEEERKQEGELSFSFSSDSRRYYLGHKDGSPFVEIACYDSLPDGLSESEKQKFKTEIRIVDGKERTAYVLSHGTIPSKKEAEPNEEGATDENQNEEYRVFPERDFEKGVLERFFGDDGNKEVAIAILAKQSGKNQSEVAQSVEQLFSAVQKKDRESARKILIAFSKEASDELRTHAKEVLMPRPKEMGVDRIAEFLKSKRILFYTGAGISMASGVHSMAELEKELQIDFSSEIDGLLKRAATNPDEVIASWEKFTKAAFESPATPAHLALASLATRMKGKVFTENVDRLQERAGIKATHVTGPWLKQNVQESWLKDIDVVITAGLSFDDRGFLAWYKKHNPNGKIVALNLNQPSYLGDEDVLVRGDIQQTLPQLQEMISVGT